METKSWKALAANVVAEYARGVVEYARMMEDAAGMEGMVLDMLERDMAMLELAMKRLRKECEVEMA